MARIFITGSADGLGQLTAKQLVSDGHKVVLHARNQDRANDAVKSVPGAEDVLIADLNDAGETKKLADAVNALGRFDAVIHNAGVHQTSGKALFTVNILAPYILTCLIEKPKRLIYLGSDMQASGDVQHMDAAFEKESTRYSDSKLYVLMLMKAVARTWPDVYANAVDPGWVPTKMGGSSAPDDLQKGFETQAWLAAGEEDKVKVTGRYFYHLKEASYAAAIDDKVAQDKLIKLCEQVSGIPFPG